LFILTFDENDAFELFGLLADYGDDSRPEYHSAMKKLHDVRYSPQEFTEAELSMMLAAAEDYLKDTGVCTTSPYDSHPFDSFAAAHTFSERETTLRLKQRICEGLSLLRPES